MKCKDKEEIVYCDNHILVAIKPCNLPTQPDDLGQDNFQDRIKNWLKVKFQKKGNVFLHCVHRLDKPVSGLVLFARSSKALSRLNEQMRQKKIKRIYYALIEGHFDKQEGDLEHYLVHQSHKAAVVGKNDGKLAKLHYRVLKKNKDTTLLEIELDTGRYHQIRAQFGHIGHPIVGDSKYGSHIFSNEIKLHQGKLEFFHPVTQEKMSFENKLD
ncbi:MAG: RluA family pseudouridine synthase [Chlamydiae bacterium]|nr:RluA family pseudouridine synthase [Chlamydiota bacterium]